MRNYLDEFIKELKNRNHAKNTIRTYSGHLKHFLTFSRRSMYEPKKRHKDRFSQTPFSRRVFRKIRPANTTRLYKTLRADLRPSSMGS